MAAPSFEGVRLQLRYRDRSIEQEVRRLAIAKTALIGFIDLMLLAGLVPGVRRNVRRELRLSRLKSDFVANVSHELKTPLALIRLFAETLELGRVPSEEKAQQYYRDHQQGEPAPHPAHQQHPRLLAHRGGAQGVPLRARATSARSCATWSRRTASRSSSRASRSRSTVRRRPAASSRSTRRRSRRRSSTWSTTRSSTARSEKCDRGRACGARATRVLLSVTRPRHRHPAARSRSKIFEKFYRAESSLVHTTKGSGLGLALVQHIMEAHGGSGRGGERARRGQHVHARRCPVRPRAARRAEDAEPQRRGTMEPRESRTSAMSKILIVEDEPDMVAGPEGQLRVRGLRGDDGAPTAQAGLEQARALKPDLLVLDVMLPKLSGLEVCKTLRGEGYEGPILMLTARGQEIDKVVGPRAGRRRLRHQALLDPRAAGPREGRPAAHRGQGQAAGALPASPTSTSTSRPTRRRRAASRSTSARASSSCCAT